MLTASDIWVWRGGKAILDGVSLALAPGMVTAMIGPNGAGKSTMLNVLSGLLSPDQGIVELDGRAIADFTRRAIACRRAVMPQDLNLSFPFRVLDVVLMGREPHTGRTKRRSDILIAEAAMRETNVLQFANRDFTTLSGGERQRVQLARVLVQVWPDDHETESGTEPLFLLLDEPTNNLDIGHQQATMVTARRFAEKGLGVLAVLHDPNLAAFYADDVCVLKNGRIVAHGPSSDVLSGSLLTDIFEARLTVLIHPHTGRPVVVPSLG